MFEAVGEGREDLEGATFVVADADWLNLRRLDASEGRFGCTALEEVAGDLPFDAEAMRWPEGVGGSWRPFVETELVR